MVPELNGKCVQVAAPAVADSDGDDERDYPVLTRESILSAPDVDIEYVQVPEWKGGLYVRNLSGTQRDAFENACAKARRGGALDVRGLMTRYVVLTACDADGTAVFTDADVDALNAKSARALSRVFDAAQRVNAMTDEDVENLLGNSGSDPSDDSGSS